MGSEIYLPIWRWSEQGHPCWWKCRSRLCYVASIRKWREAWNFSFQKCKSCILLECTCAHIYYSWLWRLHTFHHNLIMMLLHRLLSTNPSLPRLDVEAHLHLQPRFNAWYRRIQMLSRLQAPRSLPLGRMAHGHLSPSPTGPSHRNVLRSNYWKRNWMELMYSQGYESMKMKRI